MKRDKSQLPTDLRLSSGNVDVTVAFERPGDGTNEYVFRPEGQLFHDGVMLRVRNISGTWTGLFSRGQTTFSAAATMARGEFLVVVSFGQVYVVSVSLPREYTALDMVFGDGMSVCLESEVVVIWDSCSFIGLRSGDVLWETIADADGIVVTSVRGSHLLGQLIVPGQGSKDFRLDSKTGVLNI